VPEMVYATPQVELSLVGDNTGVFAFDSSLFDGTDVFGGTFGGDALDDITADVMEASGHRGRSSDLSGIEMGAMSLVLRDPTGKYNPRGTQEPGLRIKPMRRLRCRLSYLGTTEGRFSGFIRRAWHDPSKSVQRSYIEAVDLFTWLQRVNPVIASTGSTTVGAAIGLILDAAEWTDATLRDLDTGSSIPDFSADGTKNALQLVADLLAADLGLFWVDRNGVVTYRDKDHRWGAGYSSVTLSGDLVSGALPGVDGERIVNTQTVTRAGGEPQTATDEDSIATHGPRVGNQVNTPYLAEDSHAEALAQLLVALQRDEYDEARALTLHNRDATAIGHQMALEFGDHVSLTASTDGRIQAAEGGVTRIDWRLDLAGRHDTVNLTIQERVLTGFAFDESLFDGDDVFL
jgi:hypothetical protein